MSDKKVQPPSSMKGDLALVMTILSGIGSFGSLILNALGGPGLNESSVLLFQAFAALTILLAVVFIGMEWDLRRNKWSGIEDRYLQLDFISSIGDPKYTPPEYLRMRIEALRKRKRLALSEGNQKLANEYQLEIDETQKHLDGTS